MKDIISMNEVDTQRENDGYGELLAGIRRSFDEAVRDGEEPLFTTIEAYSKSEKLGGADEASACGVRLQKGLNWNAQFRVTTDIGTTIYKLDRWD